MKDPYAWAGAFLIVLSTILLVAVVVLAALIAYALKDVTLPVYLP